jgi:hypothetical protein
MGAELRLQWDAVTPLMLEPRENPRCIDGRWEREGPLVDLSCVESVTLVANRVCGQAVAAFPTEIDADAGQVMLRPDPAWNDTAGLVTFTPHLTFCNDYGPRVLDPVHVSIARSPQMPDTQIVPVIPTCKEEVSPVVTALPVGNPDGYEIVRLGAQDGANAPGLYYDASTDQSGVWVAVGSGGATEVTTSATLPATFVTPLVNLTAVDGANQPNLYRWDGGTYVPVTAAGAEEVGEGAALPADGSTWELFRLEGSATLPDGLYRWSPTANSWIQA